jgi:hypothetical protein
MKIIIGFLMIYFSLIFIAMGVGAFYMLKEMNLEPLATLNKFIIYYFLGDLAVRLLLQSIPVLNIKPLLALPLKKTTIVHFSLGKTILSFFNWIHALFFIPFTVVLILNGYDVVQIIFWHLGVMSIIYINNFLNIILSNIDRLFALFLLLIVVLGGAQYYQLFDITQFTTPFFQSFYEIDGLFLIKILRKEFISRCRTFCQTRCCLYRKSFLVKSVWYFGDFS